MKKDKVVQLYGTWFEDSGGTVLHNGKVKRIAKDNILMSLSKDELALLLVLNLDDEELLEWATDDEGLFPKEETDVDKS